MDTQKVDMFIIANGKFFRPELIPQIRRRLLELDESRWVYLQTLQFKDPTTALLLSLFTPVAAFSGIDRLYIGDITLGIVKILTCGGLLVWTIVDWFLIMDATRDKNAEILQNALMF